MESQLVESLCTQLQAQIIARKHTGVLATLGALTAVCGVFTDPVRIHVHRPNNTSCLLSLNPTWVRLLMEGDTRMF